ncbi:aminotransferase class V-fold PLP-dependent enzyme [Escherichia coli]
MNVFNPAQFRAQFSRTTGMRASMLDSAATTRLNLKPWLKPPTVLPSGAGNVHRSQFAEAQRLTARYEAAREKVAQY